MNSIQLIAHTSEKTFEDMLQCCPRKVREMLFSKQGLKPKKSSISLNLKKDDSKRSQKLHELLKESKAEANLELCQELIRNWLYRQRKMLISALDYLKIPHQDGLVEQEIDFFKQLSESDSKKLFEHLKAEFGSEHASIYLNFVEVPHVPAPSA